MSLWFKRIYKSSPLALSWVWIRKRNHEKTAIWNLRNFTAALNLLLPNRTTNSKTREVMSWPNWSTLWLEPAGLPHTHINEPPRDKTNNVARPGKTQIRPVWSESLLCAQWVAKDPRFLHVDSEDSDQTGRMLRLIWVFAERTATLLVLSWGGSNSFYAHHLIPRVRTCSNTWAQENTCVNTWLIGLTTEKLKTNEAIEWLMKQKIINHWNRLGDSIIQPVNESTNTLAKIQWHYKNYGLF